jgi:hypothetical protein
MRTFSFILLLITSVTVVSSCQPAKQGGYDAPGNRNEGQFDENMILNVDSSIEKAIEHDTTKRDYHL